MWCRYVDSASQSAGWIADIRDFFLMFCEQICTRRGCLTQRAAHQTHRQPSDLGETFAVIFCLSGGTNSFYLPMSFLEGHLSPQRPSSLNSSCTTQTVAGEATYGRVLQSPRFQLSGWNEQILKTKSIHSDWEKGGNYTFRSLHSGCWKCVFSCVYRTCLQTSSPPRRGCQFDQV